MSTSSKTTFEWTIECTAPGGIGSTMIFKSGILVKTRPSAWKLDQREDVAASVLEIRFPDAVQFFNSWNTSNALAPGACIVLKVDGFTRFTGKVYEHTFKYSGNDRSVTIVCRDRMGMLKDATVDIEIDRDTFRSPTGRFLMTRNVDENDQMFEAFDGATLLGPWHSEYIALAWWWDESNNDWYRIPFAEYEIFYDRGAIFFNNNCIKVIGETIDECHNLDDIEDEIYVEFVYFDLTDESTMISNLLRLAFGNAEAVGGLDWTEGVEYDIDDETPADILSGMKWNTDEGDGDAISFLQNLYDNPRIGLSPSYWIRDFNGNGVVNAVLVAQDNDNSIDVDAIFDAQFPSPLTNIYTRAVLVNNEATRVNLTRDTAVFTDGLLEFADNPGTFVLNQEETPGFEDLVDKHLGYLNDDTSKSSWGRFKIGTKNQFKLHENLPRDAVLFTVDLGGVEPVDLIHINCRFTFTGGEEGQTILHDSNNGMEAYNGLYVIHENQRFTVEYNTDTDATPDPDKWFVLHPSLYNAEVDPQEGRGSWLTVDGINRTARHLRVVINNPLFGKVSESNWTNDAFRIMLWFMSEFQVYGRGRVMDGDGEDQPEVKFTDDPEDEFRCMCDLAGNSVDMYRPDLLTITEAMGLKYRTLVLENSDVWEFITKNDVDCDDVSLGYKYLVSRLDANSKDNEWKIRIDPRPDIRIGHTVRSTKLDPDKAYLVHGSTLQVTGPTMTHVLTLSDHETASGGEGGGCP